MIKKIVQKDEHPALRSISKPIPDDMFGTAELNKILHDMRESLAVTSDGVALAAPQIGVALRIFVIAPIVFEKYSKAEPRLIFINPVIVKKSADKKLMEEGCLSVRNMYGKIRRSSRASIKAQDENGKEFIMHGSGLVAQIFQHETDHLDGKLFVDKAKDLKLLIPKENESEK